jgi:hypothetical protein
VKAQGRQFEFALEGPAVERFDIDQLMLEPVVLGVEAILGQSVEHESIVGIRTVADSD